MAFVKRQETHAPSNHRSVNSNRQLLDASLDVSPIEESKNHSRIAELINKVDVLPASMAKENENVTIKPKKYEKVRCHWLNFFDFDIEYRGYQEEFRQIITTYGIKAKEVKGVSEYYLCIIRSLVYLSEQRRVLWDDLAEIANALTFLCKMEAFKDLPPKYPYTNDILKLKDKLTALCISTQGEEEIAFYFDLDTKYQLLIHQRELSVFPKITFSQLVSMF